MLQGIYAEKKLVNEVLGDTTGAYHYGTGVNAVVREAMAGTTLLCKLVIAVLHVWCKPDDGMKIVDDQIGFEALKLMFMVARARMSPQSKEMLAICIKERDWAFVNELTEKAQSSGGTIDKAVKELLHALYAIDNNVFDYIGEKLGLVMQQATSLEEAKSGTEVKPLDLLKQKSLQLREALLKKFESQRQGFISKQSTTLS